MRVREIKEGGQEIVEYKELGREIRVTRKRKEKRIRKERKENKRVKI